MAKKFGFRISVLVFLVLFVNQDSAKITDNKTFDSSAEVKSPRKMTDGAALLFADELKQTLEKYLFGICPQTYKSRWLQMSAAKGKNATMPACDLDDEQQDLAGRFATLALRAHTASRSDCSRLATSLVNVLGDLARTASSRQVLAAAANEANKKRKLSKSQKLKIQAKQRTALAVKKKAAAVAAAAAAKMTTS
ncbi:uncharacterized protein LOC114248474 isoform X1 [Bombyx mandarina]|uniref:Uncharacterized protein LOC114248474 isoform X1 n=1 Tax=Bombyx mandarina TaxID=7092 RepID=A0A6J2K5H4_BOMMA|nr:uncharacterized protein LOC114248474 isoform X1 [Bombyx mandarina]